MILLIDNYDSFTYNLVHYVEELGHNVQVYRNDKISLKKIAKLNPKKIIISPGPCTPNEAGICLDLVKKFYDKMPILGVCLGHQSIGQATRRIIAKSSTIGAMAYKYSIGQAFVSPKNNLSFSENFLHMCFSNTAEEYRISPVISKAAIT